MNPAGPRRRVCLLTSSHPVGYTRFLDREARSLARAGYDVTLVGLAGRTPVLDEPGIRVMPVRPGRGLKKPLLLRRIARIATDLDAGIYQCLDPWTLRVGLGIKRIRPGVKLVYESSEWFPQMLRDRREMPWPVRAVAAQMVERLEDAACRECDAIIETNQTRSARFLRRGCEPVIVGNFPPAEMLPESTGDRQPWIVYTGLISRHRGFEQLLAAFGSIAAGHPAARLRVIGDFDPRDDIERRARVFCEASHIADRVDFLGSLPYAQMFAELGRCILGVILFQPQRGNDFTGQPNKLFEFMGAGLALVASDFPEIAPVLTKAGAGWTVNPQNPAAIAAALNEALRSPAECQRRGELGRAAVLRQYHWGVAERALLSVYAGLTT